MVIQRVPQPIYEITDLQDRPIKGHFYNYGLVKVTVSPQTEFEIDKIVRTRNKNGIKQHFVKWIGYDETFNSWINYRYQENITDHFYVTLPSDSSCYYFPANTKTDFRTKLATPLELEHDKWEVGLVKISYPKGYKKRYLYNTRRVGSEDIIFPVKIMILFLIFSQIYPNFSNRLQTKTFSYI
jgi:hypothetical protein